MYCPRVYVRTSLKTSVYWMIYPCKIKVFWLDWLLAFFEHNGHMTTSLNCTIADEILSASWTVSYHNPVVMWDEFDPGVMTRSWWWFNPSVMIRSWWWLNPGDNTILLWLTRAWGDDSILVWWLNTSYDSILVMIQSWCDDSILVITWFCCGWLEPRVMTQSWCDDSILVMIRSWWWFNPGVMTRSWW